MGYYMPCVNVGRPRSDKSTTQEWKNGERVCVRPKNSESSKQQSSDTSKHNVTDARIRLSDTGNI